jgi:hypothetical protein
MPTDGIRRDDALIARLVEARRGEVTWIAPRAEMMRSLVEAM